MAALGLSRADDEDLLGADEPQCFASLYEVDSRLAGRAPGAEGP